MKPFPRLFALAFLPLMLVLAGCSYSPARITPEPLVVVDGSHRHHHGDRHRYRERHVERHYYYDGRRDDRRRSRGFCPPGQAKKGRC